MKLNFLSAQNRVIKRHKNWHLNQHRQATARWVDAVLLIELHHFLLKLTLRFEIGTFIFLLKLLQFRAKLLHGNRRFKLLYNKRKQANANDQR